MGSGLSTSSPRMLASMKVNRRLGCIDRSIAGRSREVILHLYSLHHSGGVHYSTLHFTHYTTSGTLVQFWARQYKKDIDKLE